MIDVQGVDYIRIPATDIAASTRFYGEILGLPAGPTQHHDWAEYQAGNVTLAVMTPETHGDTFEPLTPSTFALGVPDVAEARIELEGRGVAFDGDILDTGVCHMAFFKDPDGNQLMLHRRYAPRG